jgi:uncharacterized repeat protein (TIGR01451 family)/LPXTG-motif cell wall-anchored protein
VGVPPLVDLGITKRLGSFDEASMRATWLIAVTNHGPNDTVRPVVVTDVLPTGLTYVSASGTGWVCDFSGRTLTCVFRGVVPVNATVGFELVTDVSGTSPITNVATISGTGDPNPKNDTDTATVTPPAGGNGGGLPKTGADAVSLGLLGLVALMLGIGLVGTTRRRRDAEA